MPKEDVKEVAKKLKLETQKHIGIAITSAFALLIALAWKDVVSEYVKKITERLAITGPAPLYQLYGALVTTIVCVIGIILASRWAGKAS